MSEHHRPTARISRLALGLLLSLAACAGKTDAASTKPPPPELEAVYYDSEATEPAFKGKPAVAQAASELEKNPDLHLLLIGRADSHGSADGNMKLGLERAHELRQVVLEQAAGKVDASRVHVGSRGQAEPTGSNDTESGRAANRRVEFYFYYPDGTTLKSRFAPPIVIEGE
ncbi:MAG TPA: OmpA family protein [Nannocystis sp.]